MIACVSGEEHSFIETGQPRSSDLACRHELTRVWVKTDIGITTLWHRHGNNLINCTEISLMNSYVVISMRSNSRMSFSFLMGQHSCSFGCLPTLFFPCKLHRFTGLLLSAKCTTSGAPSPCLMSWGATTLGHGKQAGDCFEMKTRSKENCGMVSLWWLHRPPPQISRMLL